MSPEAAYDGGRRVAHVEDEPKHREHPADRGRSKSAKIHATATTMQRWIRVIPRRSFTRLLRVPKPEIHPEVTGCSGVLRGTQGALPHSDDKAELDEERDPRARLGRVVRAQRREIVPASVAQGHGRCMRYWTVHRQCVVVGRIWLLQSLQPVRPLQPVQASAPAGAAGTHRKYACAWPYCRASRKLQRIAAAYRKPLHGGARPHARTHARTQRRTVWDGAADTATWIGRAGDRKRCGGTVDVINGYKRP